MRSIDSEIQFKYNDNSKNGYNIFCPYCNEQVVEIDESLEFININPCKHFSFFIINDEFERVSEKFVGKVLEAHKNFNDFEYPNSLEKMDYDEDLCIIEDEVSGIACGPLSTDLYYGFDENQEEYKEADITD